MNGTPLDLAKAAIARHPEVYDGVHRLLLAEVERLSEQDQHVERLIDTWLSSPGTRTAIAARYPGLAWAIEALDAS